MNDIKKRFADFQSKLNDLLVIKKEEYEEECDLVNEYVKNNLEIAKNTGTDFKKAVLLSSDEYKSYEKKQHQVDMLEKLIKKLETLFQTPSYIEKARIKESYKDNQSEIIAKINDGLDEIEQVNDMLRESFIVRYRDEAVEEELNKVIPFEEEIFGDNTKEQLALYHQRNRINREVRALENELKLLIDERQNIKYNFDEVINAFKIPKS